MSRLIGDDPQPKAMLKLRQTPRFAWNDLLMRQPQDEQIGQYRYAKGLFHLISVPPHLVLAQSEVRFQIPIDELHTPPVLVDAHHLSRRRIGQIGHQEFGMLRAHVTPGFAQHQGDISNVVK